MIIFLKKIKWECLILIFTFLTPSFVFAIPRAPVDFDQGLDFTDIIPFFNNIVSWLISLLIVAGVIGVVVSGYMLLFSSGDSGKVASARQILIFSLLGVMIGTLASPIVWWARGGFKDDEFFGAYIENIAIWLSNLLAVAATIGVVISGYMFVTSGGDSGKVSSAKNILIYSLVGFVVGINASPFVAWARGGFQGVIFEVALRNIYVWLVALLLQAALIGIVISGYMFITSGGDSGKVASARQMLIYSLVGVLVGSTAWGITQWAFGGFYGGAGVMIGVYLLNIANWLFSLLLIAGVIGIVISGYMFITSGGDSGKVASARQMLIYSLVGVLVGSISRLLVQWVYNFFN